MRDSVRCPNCGEDEIETEVCPTCNKPLSVEWRKLEGESPYFDHPPQGHHTSPEWSFPDRVDKTNWNKTDNSFPSMISSVQDQEYLWYREVGPSGGPTSDEFF